LYAFYNVLSFHLSIFIVYSRPSNKDFSLRVIYRPAFDINIKKLLSK